MANPPPPVPPSAAGSLTGGSCVHHFADFVRTPIDSNGVLYANPGVNSQYVLVHIYLVPRDASTRLPFRNALHTELGKLDAVQLHDLAYAVPASSGDEERMAELTWNHLTFAGAAPPNENGADAWLSGDAVYLHYRSHEGMRVVACAPREGHRLHQPDFGRFP